MVFSCLRNSVRGHLEGMERAVAQFPTDQRKWTDADWANFSGLQKQRQDRLAKLLKVDRAAIDRAAPTEAKESDTSSPR
jgi:hypothetical protein